MELKVIPLNRVAQVWPEVAVWLQDALKHSKGDYTLDHAQLYVSSGQWMLVVAYEGERVLGAATVNFYNMPTKRIAFITATAGRKLLTAESMEQLRAICRQYGATHIECATRESMSRMLHRFGFTEKYRTMEVPL